MAQQNLLGLSSNGSSEADPEGLNAARPNPLTFVESSDPFDRYAFRLSRIIHRGRTAFQDVLIADSYNFGRLLVLDGAIQSSEDDEELYHEVLVQPAMLIHHDPKRVLIIGGGEGATLREVLVHRAVEHVTMVDIDRELVELCRQHLVAWHRGAFDDPRVRLLFEDGRRLIEREPASYDVVVIDVVDMLDNGPAQFLYTRQFYEALKRRLRPHGIVVVQGLEFSFLDDKPHAALLRTLRSVFREAHSYRTDIPSFLSAWGFLIASDRMRPEQWSAGKIDRRISERIGDWPKHITGDFLKGLFRHCKKTLAALARSGPILDDGVPFRPPPEDDVTEDSARVRFPILPKVRAN